MTTNVPAPTFGPAGFTAPAESDVLAGVLADLNAAFGGNLNLALETPQGQLASSLAAVIGFCNDTLLALFNNVDPAYSSGRMQDAIARIYFLERNPAEPTTVTATCTGAVGTVIPLGSLARASDGTVYASTAAATIAGGGTVSVPFAATVTGPIACPSGSLTTVYKAVPGWDAITNPAEGVLGRNTETPAEFEARRAASVALNSAGTLAAIRAAVASVKDVLDVYAAENPTGSPATVGGVTLAAHSLFVSVAGGADADVAKAIWTKKNPGVAYNGNTTVTVTDDSVAFAIPKPTYGVTFTRPAPLAVKFAVTLANGPSVPANVVSLVREAVKAAFSGSDGGPRARIGSTVFASRFYAGIAQLGPWSQIVSVHIGTGAGSPASDSVTAHIDQVPTVADSDIAVTLA